MSRITVIERTRRHTPRRTFATQEVTVAMGVHQRPSRPADDIRGSAQGKGVHLHVRADMSRCESWYVYDVNPAIKLRRKD